MRNWDVNDPTVRAVEPCPGRTLEDLPRRHDRRDHEEQECQ